jgi:hypothetical protein
VLHHRQNLPPHQDQRSCSIESTLLWLSTCPHLNSQNEPVIGPRIAKNSFRIKFKSDPCPALEVAGTKVKYIGVSTALAPVLPIAQAEQQSDIEVRNVFLAFFLLLLFKDREANVLQHAVGVFEDSLVDVESPRTIAYDELILDYGRVDNEEPAHESIETGTTSGPAQLSGSGSHLQ